MPVKVIIISAMTESRVIGTGQGMPWSIPEEYQHFLDSVRGQTMIMGRKSWDIFGGDVDTQHNMVISRRARVDHAELFHDLEQAVTAAQGRQKTIFIAGGGEIYAEALSKGLVDEMHLSYIKADHQGSIYFPEWKTDDWHLEESRDFAEYRFCRYVKLKT
jgi:dihydrofolate reductase